MIISSALVLQGDLMPSILLEGTICSPKHDHSCLGVISSWDVCGAPLFLESKVTVGLEASCRAVVWDRVDADTRGLQ